MKAPLTMAGDAVWNGQNVQVRMSFQCAKDQRGAGPSLTQTGGPLAWTTVRTTSTTCPQRRSGRRRTPASQNEQVRSLRRHAGLRPGCRPDEVFPALYTYGRRPAC